LGGDEFAVLLEDIEYEAAVEIVERLLNVVRPPLLLDNREVFVQCSIGVKTVDATSEEDVDVLLRDADVAMYAAKRAGGDTYRHFEAAVADRVELRDELRAAIDHRELTLAYQPIFDFQTGELAGVEALARWEHPSRGAVPPSVFIPVAEDAGLIVGLGNWVLRTACSAAAALQQAAPRARRPSIAVNVSAGQLYRPELVEEVRAALAMSHLEPRDLVLEITESLLIDDITLAIERLTALRALGVRIALDDFGSGYSSLSYIRRLPIDQLKIDKHFIDTADRDERDSKLIATIIEMASVLDLDTVAEGIERPEQHQQLKQLGCTYAQGFLLAKPMSIDHVRQLINATPVPLKRVA
jgi:EAL domain-containing protein (putative c-di-GMP-specific phosphodiesterase class I)